MVQTYLEITDYNVIENVKKELNTLIWKHAKTNSENFKLVWRITVQQLIILI